MVDLKIMSVAAEGGTGWRVPQFKILGGGRLPEIAIFTGKIRVLTIFSDLQYFQNEVTEIRGKETRIWWKVGLAHPNPSPPPPVKTSWRRPGYKWNVSRPNAMFTNCQLYVVLWCQKNGKWCHLSKKSAF